MYDSDATQTAADANAAAPTRLSPSVQLVHAAIGLGDVRICFTDDTNPAQPSNVKVPHTNYAGLAVGRSVLVPDGTNLNGKKLDEAFVVSADGLGQAEYGRTPYSCQELSSNPLINKIAVAPDTLTITGAAVLALLGCPPNVGDAARCGKGFDLQKGNLRFQSIQVGGLVPDQANQIGLFVLNLSPSVEANVNGTMAVSRIGALANPCNGVNMEIGKSTFAVGSLAPSAMTVTRPMTFDVEGFAACRMSGAPIVVKSYAQLQDATVPESLPAEHFEGRADFVFTIVGDLSVATGPESVHALAIRFDAE